MVSSIMLSVSKPFVRASLSSGLCVACSESRVWLIFCTMPAMGIGHMICFLGILAVIILLFGSFKACSISFFIWLLSKSLISKLMDGESVPTVFVSIVDGGWIGIVGAGGGINPGGACGRFGVGGGPDGLGIGLALSVLAYDLVPLSISVLASVKEIFFS